MAFEYITTFILVSYPEVLTSLNLLGCLLFLSPLHT